MDELVGFRGCGFLGPHLSTDLQLYKGKVLSAMVIPSLSTKSLKPQSSRQLCHFRGIATSYGIQYHILDEIAELKADTDERDS